MTWGWEARGKLPADGSGTGTTGGGSIGTLDEAAKTKAWPRYEAEYLKRALQSERYKYDAEGLSDAEKSVYLDKVVANYKAEADECLKAEFEQWLQGQHEANDSSKDQLYDNADGKPVRRWVFRSPESEDDAGGYKVGQARAGWKHTPWGRAALVHLPGVREYLRNQKQTAHDKDTEMQMLAEFGPQNIKQAWAYFKHWVKGRPMSDAVALPPHFATDEVVARAEFGSQQPNRMYAYDSEPNDRQPGVRASDPGAASAAISQPGKPEVTTTTESEDRNVEEARELRIRMSDLARTWGFGEQRDVPAEEIRAREDSAEAKEQAVSARIAANKKYVADTQRLRQAELAAPTTNLMPALK